MTLNLQCTIIGHRFTKVTQTIQAKMRSIFRRIILGKTATDASCT
ncbi:hypothetical protein HMPREF9373_2389 [Psychrobacter sp. 1501(2011)]|nr:hypothetical protein HMPREF9373_2389 [Psychrobacter sp. 1501(2011)]